MSDAISFGELEVVASMEESPARAEPETPFRIALLGDWSGRENRKLQTERIAPKQCQPILIDRDNFDEVMSQLEVSLNLPVAENAPPLALRFNELDDFHPDRIYERVELFAALRETRERLEDDSTYEAAAEEVRSWAGSKDKSEAIEPSSESTPPASDLQTSISDNGLLERMLEETDEPRETSKNAPEDDELRTLLREAVRPFLVSVDEAQQASLVGSVDEATSRLMRSILHHQDFQSLEAAWRAAYLLVSRLETGVSLKLYLIDITKDELATDLNASEKLEATGVYKLLVEQSVNTFGGELWGALTGNYTFNPVREDARMLGRLAKIAKRAGAPFIAGASAHALGCESLAETPDPDDWHSEIEAEDVKAWDAFRHLPEASYVGLALPRFLVRLPYGALTEPLERFDFEEMPEGSKHENYLWANPSFACALLLGQAFTEHGWDLQPGALQDIEGLPLHIYQEEGDSYIKPCAETLLTMRAAEKILDAGLMPLLSFQGRDTIRVARFQSLAEPALPLAGLWH
ncbi:MAG: type VI secretion system contractile sheath large subunit [Pyrinomonadaceae bacterium]|nr:type VI secretion system contractile sheath large subunit [Pyrinomonadaceae bacterium]